MPRGRTGSGPLGGQRRRALQGREGAGGRDPSAAVALATEAEALASDGHGAWTLANVWRALGRADEATRILDSALAVARSSRDALSVARAWSSHGDAANVERALGRARTLATDAQAWLDLAEVAFDAKCAGAVVRSALEEATTRAEDGDVRGRIACPPGTGGSATRGPPTGWVRGGGPRPRCVRPTHPWWGGPHRP